MNWYLALALGYLSGSIPFGVILTRLFGAGDLRTIGSGNIGATNVLRTGRKGIAAATLLLDMAKGLAPVLIIAHWWPVLAVLGGLGAVIGHCFPLWLGFRGGKGVATFMGVSLGLFWPLGVIYAVVWIGLLLISRISSLGGIGAALAMPFSALLTGRSDLVSVMTILAVLVIFRHRANIRRIMDGTEPKVGSKS